MKRIITVVFLGLLLIFTSCTGNQQKSQNTPPKNNTSTTQQKVFTLDELKKYNGQNGNPAYVAVNGVVYDVTNSRAWRNGLHDDCSNSTYAGADLTNLIKSSPHGTNVLKKFPVVGALKK